MIKLHVTNLAPHVTEGQLRELFERFGMVFGLKLSWSSRLGRVSGSAVIEMNETTAAQAAKELNGRAFRHRRIYITLMHNRPPAPQQAREASQSR